MDGKKKQSKDYTAELWKTKEVLKHTWANPYNSAKQLKTLKNCLYYAKTVFREVWRTTPTLIQTQMWFQIRTAYQHRTQHIQGTTTITRLRTGETWKKELFTSSFITHIPALQAQLLAERNKEDSRLVSASSQRCQGITDFQEDKDIITWQIPRNAIAIESDLSTFPRCRVWPDSEENWVHSSCSMNPCSETKAEHAAAEENQGTAQKETPHLPEKLGNPNSKVFCRALSPWSVCSQHEPYFTNYTPSNHRQQNNKQRTSTQQSNCLQLQPLTTKLKYKVKVSKSATT